MSHQKQLQLIMAVCFFFYQFLVIITYFLILFSAHNFLDYADIHIKILLYM